MALNALSGCEFVTSGASNLKGLCGEPLEDHLMLVALNADTRSWAFVAPGQDPNRYGVDAAITLYSGGLAGSLMRSYGTDAIEVLSPEELEQIRLSADIKCEFFYDGLKYRAFRQARAEDLIGRQYELNHKDYTCRSENGENIPSRIERLFFSGDRAQVYRYAQGDLCTVTSQVMLPTDPSSYHISRDGQLLLGHRGVYRRIQ